MTATRDLQTTSHPMHLTLDPWWGNFELLAFGTVTDGLPSERFHTIDADARVRPGAGLPDRQRFRHPRLRRRGAFELDAEALWDRPRFDVPVLGLAGATAGEVVLAVRGRFAEDEPTADAMHFHLAIGEEDPAAAVAEWRLALEAGDMKAHYGLGYTLCALGAFRDAYDHLRRYTELVPTNAWAWCWLGQACAGLGDVTEARAAYARAVEIDGDETDAPALLAALLP